MPIARVKYRLGVYRVVHLNAVYTGPIAPPTLKLGIRPTYKEVGKMKTSRFISVVVASLASVAIALVVAGPANAVSGPSVAISPLGVITTSQYFSFVSPGGLARSYTDNHTNTNNVTIGWTGATGAVSVSVQKGSYSCAISPSAASSKSKVCTGVPSGTLTIVATGNNGVSATFYDSYSI